MATRPSPTTTQKPLGPPKPQLSIHPTATISENSYFQGTYHVSIGAGTVVHPRAKFLAFEGPISIGEGCIIGEKSIIGGPLSSSISKPTSSTPDTGDPEFNDALTFHPDKSITIIENSVAIGPLTTISAGSHIYSAAAIDTSAVLGKNVRVGKHSKVCASCIIPEGDIIDDWTVIWSGGGGMKLHRRKRVHGKDLEESTDGKGGFAPGLVETGRLVVLNRERESLAKLIGIGAGKKK
ncbi:hypothetical protein FQN57_007458 [Myotisia sp. PD_48]|nr:hypothetical protein FQN57_007458 [Myotisia sp. PD_48]